MRTIKFRGSILGSPCSGILPLGLGEEFLGSVEHVCTCLCYPKVSVLPPLSNSWIIIVIWLYIALDRTPNIDCYWGGSIQPKPLNPKPYAGVLQAAAFAARRLVSQMHLAGLTASRPCT